MVYEHVKFLIQEPLRYSVKIHDTSSSTFQVFFHIPGTKIVFSVQIRIMYYMITHSMYIPI